jgi:hypothetical protein
MVELSVVEVIDQLIPYVWQELIPINSNISKYIINLSNLMIEKSSLLQETDHLIKFVMSLSLLDLIKLYLIIMFYGMSQSFLE